MLTGLASLIGNVMPLEVTFMGPVRTQNVNGNTITITGADFGAAHPMRRIVLLITISGDTALRTISSTVGGVACDVLVTDGTQGSVAAIHLAHIPTGTSGTITVTSSASLTTQMTVGIYRVIGMKTNAPFAVNNATGGPSMTLPVAVPRGGAVFSVVRRNNTSSYVWSGVDEDYDLVLSNALTQGHSGAHRDLVQASASYDVTVVGAGSGMRMCVASFGP